MTPLLPHSRVALITSLLALACRAQPGGGADHDPVLLALGDETIRRSDFERHVAAVQARGGGSSLAPEVRQALLEPFLEERILVLEARARGLSARGDAEEKESESVRRLLSDAVLSRVSLTDEELDAYCRDHARDFDRPERIRLRQILVPTSNEARDVVRRLKKDPKSFATLAQTRSLAPEVRRALLEPYLEERILVLEARSRGLVARGDAEEKENESVRRLLTEAVLSRVSLTDVELDAYCQEHARDFDRPERIRLRQILVPTPNEARDVVRRLKKDPKSFATLAQTRSRGPEASTGGTMGTFGRGELPAELEGPAFALAAGETSDVVQSPLGYHVLRVDERVAASQTDLPQCREAARAELFRRKSDQSVRQFVQGLMARAKVNHEAVTGSRPS